MKKVLRSLIMASLCFIGVASANAQNRYTFGDGGKTETSTLITSDNISVKQIDNHSVSLSYDTKPKHPSKANAQTHTLTINVNDGLLCQKIHVSSGDSYLNSVENTFNFSDEVEEGYYDIMVYGYCGDFSQGIITYDSVPVFENTTFEASFNDCVYSLGIDAFDEDGYSLSEMDFVSNDYLVWFFWIDGIADQGFLNSWMPFLSEIPNLRFSSFDERSYVTLVATYHTVNQKAYNIAFPSIRGLSNNAVFENNPAELISHQEKFNLNSQYTSYYYLCSYTYYDFHGDFGWCSNLASSLNLTFDNTQPITIVSNNLIDNPFVFDNNPKVTLFPAIYELWEAKPLLLFGLHYNNNRQLEYEPFGKIVDGYGYGMTPNYLEHFPETPAINTYNPEIVLSYGERTPMYYYQAYNLKPDNSPSGKYSFIPRVLPIGERGCQGIDYKNVMATILYNGEQIFNDSLYKWSEAYQNEDPGFVTMTFYDRHLMIEGVEKYSTVNISFDFNREDITAPTMTILQVKNENGKESIELPNIASSCINFAAGDFSPHYTETGGYGHYDYMQYDSKPYTVLVMYSNSETGEWFPLQFEEEENMFHESYGNYYTIDLSQLRDEDVDKWISLQFVFGDEAGNSYNEVLSNVFYVGHLESVNEHTANSLQHTVYPNPFNGEVRITAAQPVNGVANIVIYNVLGEQVYSKSENCTETQDFTIDGSAWKPGVYFYSINTKDGVLQGKIVKE